MLSHNLSFGLRQQNEMEIDGHSIIYTWTKWAGNMIFKIDAI